MMLPLSYVLHKELNSAQTVNYALLRAITLFDKKRSKLEKQGLVHRARNRERVANCLSNNR